MKIRWIVTLLFISLQLIPAQAQDAATDLLGRINTLRGQLGLAPYTLHPALVAAAQNQAQWMVDTGEVSHVQSDGSLPRDRAAAAGYTSPWVSENIYMGGLATVNDAWNFWLNSSIHYAGLTSANYQQIGIAAAQGANGQAFVLVFGNTGGTSSSSSGSTTSGNTSARNAPAAAPAYVVGVDSVGNIMHEVQAGDTLGGILLLYGYSWDDLPALLALNDMSEADIRTLEIGHVLLVPPKAGTYTPTPELSPEATEEADQLSETAVPSSEPALSTTLIPTATPAVPSPTALSQSTSPTPVPTLAPTHGMIISTLPAATTIAAASFSADQPVIADQPTERSRPPLWLIGAILFQAGILIFASLEFMRRLWKRD